MRAAQQMDNPPPLPPADVEPRPEPQAPRLRVDDGTVEKVAALLAVALLDAFRLGVRVTRGARARFPGEVVDGWRTGLYAFMRAHRMRRLRLPRPRVAVGDPVP